MLRRVAIAAPAPHPALTMLRVLAALVACLAFARPASAQWQANGTPVCTAGGDQVSPVVLADGSGGAFVVWEDRRGADPQVYAQHFNSSGVALWGVNGQLVSSGSYPQYGPVAVGDGAGGLYIVWILSIVPGAYTGQGTRLNGAGTPYWYAGGGPVLPGSAFPTKLAIISDGTLPFFETPGAIVAWTDIRNGITTDIYIHAFNSMGTARWTTPVCTAAGNQEELSLVSDGSGVTASTAKGAIVAWRDHRNGLDDSDIYAQRITYAGAAALQADGVGVATGAGNVHPPTLVRSLSQNAIAVWPGPAGGRSFGNFADRVGTTGTWGAPVPVTVPNGSQSTDPAAVTDQANGVVTAWSVVTASLTRDVYAQRIDVNGNRMWGDGGKLVCVSDGVETSQRLLAGLSGTTVVAWLDNRVGGVDRDLFAQLLDANGDRVWSDDGVPVCVGPGNILDLAMAFEPSGGAIIAWVDMRNGNQDIYINRVTGAGAVVSAPATARASMSLSAPFPNPASDRLSMMLDLPEAEEVTASVHDVSGRTVKTLREREWLPAGRHALTWDVLDAGGAPAPASVYWIRANTKHHSVSRRAVVVR